MVALPFAVIATGKGLKARIYTVVEDAVNLDTAVRCMPSTFAMASTQVAQVAPPLFSQTPCRGQAVLPIITRPLIWDARVSLVLAFGIRGTEVDLERVMKTWRVFSFALWSPPLGGFPVLATAPDAEVPGKLMPLETIQVLAFLLSPP